MGRWAKNRSRPSDGASLFPRVPKDARQVHGPAARRPPSPRSASDVNLPEFPTDAQYKDSGGAIATENALDFHKSQRNASFLLDATLTTRLLIHRNVRNLASDFATPRSPSIPLASSGRSVGRRPHTPETRERACRNSQDAMETAVDVVDPHAKTTNEEQSYGPGLRTQILSHVVPPGA